MTPCPASPLDIGLVRDILGSVDCNVQAYSMAGYRALAGPASPLPAALTALLTIYVAILGYRMLFAVGGARLADAPLIALKIGAILALTLNWSVFQKLVYDVAARAPLEIGRVISRPMALSGSGLAEDPVQGIQTAYDELTADASELARKAGQGAQGAQSNEAVTAAGLRRASAALLAGTAGVLAMSFIATGVLTAVGPVFIALFLFEATRGFCVGWLRALVGAILTPMVCWVGASLLLVVLAPRIDTLAAERAAHAISLDDAAAAAAIVLIFAVAQAMLVVSGLVIAGGFRLERRVVGVETAETIAREAPPRMQVVELRSRAQVLAANLQRTTSPSSAAALQGYGEASGGPALSGAEPARRDGVARIARLGETYRRGAMTRNRGRLGARA